MAKKTDRYKQMEQFMTAILSLDAVAFILFMIFAGLGIIWLKVIFIVLCLILSGFLLWILYASRELLRQRSLWITIGAVCIVICLFFSLILNYPSPNKYKPVKQEPSNAYQMTQTK